MNVNIQNPLRTTILHIRSKDATQLTDGLNTNFRVNLSDPVFCNKNEEVRISVMSCEIPASYYNISSALENNILKYNSTSTLTFTNQDYSINQFINFMNNDAGFSSIFTTTYDKQKNKLTITNDTGSTQTINFSTSNANREMGFSETKSDVDITAGGSITSDFVCNMATIHSFMIKSTSAGSTNVISTRAGTSTTIQKISVDVNSNGIVYLNQQDFRQTTITQTPVIDEIVFRITDQNDNLLDLNNVNFEFSMLFEVFKHRGSVDLVRSQTQPFQTIPTQPMNMIEEEEDEEENITKQYENLEEDRLVLDELIDKFEA